MIIKLYDGKHPDTAMLLNNVGQCYEAIGEYSHMLKYS